MPKIAVDAMGGDRAPGVVVEGAWQAAKDLGVEVVLVGEKQAVERELSRLNADPLEIIPASESVAMHESPSSALKKKDSSMRVAVQQVKDGTAQAAVSAGNTGALMAISRYVLKTLDGIERPAIAGQIPNATGGATTVLDLGANVDCTAEHLLQFAVMGSALVSVLKGEAQPSVGLLNIGEEVIKGNEVIKKAGELLRSAAKSGDLNFVGNVEGNDIFKGQVDIVVCDGFVGNVALKTA